MAWDSTIPVFITNDVPTHTQLNKFINNLNYLKSRDIADRIVDPSAGNHSTTSTTFVDVPNTTFTATFKAGQALVVWRAYVLAGTGTVKLALNVDGTDIGLDGTTTVRPNIQVVPLIVRIVPVTAASHTFKIRWRTTAGTATIAASSNVFPFIYVREISWTP